MQQQNNNEGKGCLTKYVKDPEMIRVLNRKGIKELFPVQYETFFHIYDGKDIVAKDRTGSGKTMAFALPVITKFRETNVFSSRHTPKFLIVLPTRQLAIQVKEQIQSLRLIDSKNDFTVGAVYGGSSMSDQRYMVERGLDIVVGTPGRMIDFLEKGIIRCDDIKVTCLDEADEMLRQGFKEEIEKIFAFVKAKQAKTQNLLFSATIPEWIWEISNQYQSRDRVYIDLIKGKTAKTSQTVKHYCLPCNPYDKELYISSLIAHFIKEKLGKIIIFCDTKRDVDKIGNSPNLPVKAHCLHGDIRQSSREHTFRKFKNGQIDCIVATNVAARGLDFPQIDLIIQMQPPKTCEEYIHRSGRTGRAGREGACVTLFTRREEQMMERIQHEANIRFEFLKEADFKKVEKKQSTYDSRKNDDYSSQNRYSQQSRPYGQSNGYHNSSSNYNNSYGNSYGSSNYNSGSNSNSYGSSNYNSGSSNYNSGYNSYQSHSQQPSNSQSSYQPANNYYNSSYQSNEQQPQYKSLIDDRKVEYAPKYESKGREEKPKGEILDY